jgi:hypothetical protein
MNLRLIICCGLAVGAAACTSTPPISEERQAIDAANRAAGQALAAQAPAEDALLAPWLRTERARVASARAAAETQFTEDERTCWRRFAVNDCIRQARQVRRAFTDRLQQEDLALNAVERSRRTAQRLETLENKRQDALDRGVQQQ